MKPTSSEYVSVLVESFNNPEHGKGHRLAVAIRPLAGQPFPQEMLVECASQMRTDYPVGTIFRIRAIRKQKEASRPHLYSPYRWAFEVVPRQQNR